MTTPPVQDLPAPQDFPPAPPLEDEVTGNLPVEAPAPAVRGVGLLTRLHLTEPVRLWLYSVGAALLGLLAVKGWLNGWPVQDVVYLLGALLGVPAVTEALRTSTWSERSATALAVDAAQRTADARVAEFTGAELA